MKATKPKGALKRAIDILGSQTKVAEVVGVSQPSVSYALHEADDVPAEWCLPIERATKGEVTRHQLRPDIYPLEDAGSRQ
jgi:DNA-binding transcriptional regulator YdaS (Cro superfamily)